MNVVLTTITCNSSKTTGVGAGGLIKALYQSEYAIHFAVGEYSGFTATTFSVHPEIQDFRMGQLALSL